MRLSLEEAEQHHNKSLLPLQRVAPAAARDEVRGQAEEAGRELETS